MLIINITMKVFKFLKNGGVKNIVMIANLVKASKAAKGIAATGVAIAVTPDMPIDPKTALLVSIISMLCDALISYIKGRENKKKD